MAKQIISVRVDPVINAALRKIAATQHVTITELVEKALIDLVDVCPLCEQEIRK